VVTQDGNPLEPQITIPSAAQQISIAQDGTVSYTLNSQTGRSRPARFNWPLS